MIFQGHSTGLKVISRYSRTFDLINRAYNIFISVWCLAYRFQDCVKLKTNVTVQSNGYFQFALACSNPNTIQRVLDVLETVVKCPPRISVVFAWCQSRYDTIR